MPSVSLRGVACLSIVLATVYGRVSFYGVLRCVLVRALQGRAYVCRGCVFVCAQGVCGVAGTALSVELDVQRKNTVILKVMQLCCTKTTRKQRKLGGILLKTIIC